MKAILAGLSLSLLASAALAQVGINPPADTPPPVPPVAGQTKPGMPEGSVGGGPKTVPGQGPDAAADPGSYEGMIVQTPQGTYLVTEPDVAADGQMPPAGRPGEGPEPRPMDGGMTMPRPPRPMGGPMGRPPVPPSTAARFRIQSGDMFVGVTCAENEPTKACIDAIGQIVDKIGGLQRH